MAKNVFGEDLIVCSTNPMTGFFRNGCCETNAEDLGTHVVCAIMTTEFLEFTKSRGNDLSTARPEYHFSGLKSGDKWCLCALRWKEAWEADKAPLVFLEATHEAVLQYTPLEELIKFAWKNGISESKP